jgi:hypothetical protein
MAVQMVETLVHAMVEETVGSSVGNSVDRWDQMLVEMTAV